MLESRASLEIEVKIAVAAAAPARNLLQQAGFRVCQERVFEQNTVLDTPDGSLRRAGRLLRLRQAGAIVTATFKGRSRGGRHKTREEIEFRVSSLTAAGELLSRLGYTPVFRYEKYRTEFARPDEPGIVTLDETPIGTFLELEGPANWIDHTAPLLGFGPQDFITDSYSALYTAFCKRAKAPPSDMLFPQGANRPAQP